MKFICVLAVKVEGSEFARPMTIYNTPIETFAQFEYGLSGRMQLRRQQNVLQVIETIPWYKEHEMGSSGELKYCDLETVRILELMLEEFDNKHKIQAGDVIEAFYHTEPYPQLSSILICIEGSNNGKE